MAIALDLAVILIFAVVVVVVVKKGFVRTVLDFASVVCALIFAKIFSPLLSNIYYAALYDGVSEKLAEKISELIENNSLPEALKLDRLTALISKYDSGFADRIKGDTITDSARLIAQPLVGLLSYALAFLTIFVASLIIFKIISVLVGGIFTLPVLRTVNKSLAFLLGLVLGAAYAALFVALTQILTPFISSYYPDVINPDTISNTYIFGYLYNLEWIKIFVN